MNNFDEDIENVTICIDRWQIIGRKYNGPGDKIRNQMDLDSLYQWSKMKNMKSDMDKYKVLCLGLFVCLFII